MASIMKYVCCLPCLRTVVKKNTVIKCKVVLVKGCVWQEKAVMGKQVWTHHQQVQYSTCPIRTHYITNTRLTLSRAILSSFLSALLKSPGRKEGGERRGGQKTLAVWTTTSATELKTKTHTHTQHNHIWNHCPRERKLRFAQWLRESPMRNEEA